jgi:hypothetical protein
MTNTRIATGKRPLLPRLVRNVPRCIGRELELLRVDGLVHRGCPQGRAVGRHFPRGQEVQWRFSPEVQPVWRNSKRASGRQPGHRKRMLPRSGAMHH